MTNDGAPVDDFEVLARRRVVELGDDIDLDAFAAMFDLFRVSARVIGDLENTVHRPIGLSIAGFRVLFTVWVHGSLEPREIARLSGVSRAAVSGVVNTLERDGFAARQRVQADGRLVTVSVTPAGSTKLREAYRLQHARERELFAALPASELAQFTTTMRTLLAARPTGAAEGS
ncbi:MAG: MarR family transcriptional regulator [Ilumatobacter sp.]|nr:MarR family transcriptional regulator [Ilumatobacter sp.]